MSETQQPAAPATEPQVIRVPGFVLKTPYGSYAHCGVEMPADGYLTICKHTIEVEMPAGFSETAAQVAQLQMLREKAARDFAATVRDIDEQISKLQCLEMTPAAGAAS